MKKTLLAMTLAASSVSGSAMAWTANGTGSSLELGGTLSPVATTLWEIQTGNPVNNLDSTLLQGERVSPVSLPDGLTLLGIRTTAGNTTFAGNTGISPQIQYGDGTALDLDRFSAGRTTLTLDANDIKGNKIGVFTARVTVIGFLSAKYTVGSGKTSGRQRLYAAQAGDIFFGGLPKVSGQTDDTREPVRIVIPDLEDNYDGQGLGFVPLRTEQLLDTTATYSAYYGAVAEKGSTATLTLDQPATTDAVEWKASLPITVSYQ